jgi:hypothetical protein
MEMLDDVCADMRLEWPGRHVRGQRSRYADASVEQSPFFTGRE